MKIRNQSFILTFILGIAAICLSFIPIVTRGATLASNGTAPDVAAKIAAAVGGDVVTIPAGVFSWPTGVTIAGKGIKIVGAGGGRVDGASKSVVTIGTGTKSFTIWKAVNGSGKTLSSVVSSFNVGETVRAVYKANGTEFMEGTVTSFDGNTLTIDVTTTGGSGSPSAWNFVVPAATTIVHNAGTATLFNITEDTTSSVEISDLCIASGTGTGSMIELRSATGGKPFQWHDCRVSNTGGNRIIHSTASRGLIWKCYWDTGFRFGSIQAIPGYGLAVKDDIDTSNWATKSKMGTDDTDGLQNFYVEQCFFAGLITECFDADGGARLVVRDSVFDSSGFTSHGADTGPIGQRHFQLYDNLWIFENLGTETVAMCYTVYVRGGTGIIADNVMPDLQSTQWGSKAEIILTVQNLQRSSGPNSLWGSNIAGIQYPCPRQVGLGNITGSGKDGEGRTNDSVTYVGDSEPMYQWNNTGGGNYASPSIANYSTPTTGQDDVSGYIQIGRDYINGVKPGFQKYPYPHPLRSSSSTGGIAGLNAPTNAKVNL